ncbi:S-layer homology domain-containing protein [Pseudoflavonifractor sp. CLA-AP-H29]|uniref:S-layer homology domain-containing protein n=1 Tax=Pseudoflavonifractor intestinihominis TaxID=3133171 RepID=A0ABV1E6Z0_9FIRM
MKKTAKRACSLLCVLAMLLGLLPGAALAAEGPNLVQNPDFLTEDNWEFVNGGVSGGHFYLDEDGRVSQKITIPADGTYAVSGKLATASGTVDCTFGVKMADGDVLKEEQLASGLDYDLIELGTFDLQQDDVIEVYATRSATGNWVNGNGIKVVDVNYPEPAPDYSGNLLQDPGFENGGTGWYFANSKGDGTPQRSGSGIQTNNPHTGSRGFFLDGGESNAIRQTVTVPYNGCYTTSAYIATGGSGAVFGIKDSGDQVLDSATLPNGATYSAPHALKTLELKQGDEVTVYVTGGSAWTNGDDISFAYDFSQVAYNLLSGLTLEGTTSVRLPWAGDYIFTADITGGTVTVNGQEVADGKLSLTGLELDSMAEIVVSDGCTVENASLTLDTSSIPNEAPTATDVAFTGILHSGQILTGSYTFTDTDEGQGGKEGVTAFRWLSADAIDGEYTAIEGETGKTLALTDDLDGKYIKFEVTPVDGYGKAGETVTTEAQGPVVINYVRNPGLEIESSYQPVGWATKNGGSMPNNFNDARGGFRFARIFAGDSDAEVYYTADIPMTANYTAGAWINTDTAAGTLGVRTTSGAVLQEITLPATSGEYQFVELTFAAEGGTQVEFYLKGAEGCSQIYGDDFQILYKDKENLPEFVTLHAFDVEGATSVKMDNDAKTIAVTVPYETDVTALTVTSKVSEGATIQPASGSAVDFSEPVEFTITNGSSSATWTVTVTVAEKCLVLTSDNEILTEGFNWAVQKTNQFVMTGKSGLINKSESGAGTGPVDYMPSYWAGYYDRTAFYGRDFVHQAVGGQIVGLWNENWNMFHTFAAFASESRDWYTGWAFNFDGSIYTLDYKNDNNFVREVPAQFELVEKAYKQYLWSGDRRYIEDETMWNFYTKVMTDFVELHDTNGNGIAEGTGGGIFSGSCTYNERGGQPIIEAGDAIGSQYQATLAYAAMLKERGELEESEAWYAKADELKRYFNEEWSVMPDDEDGTGLYARALSTDGVTKYDDFGKENSWFMPMKLITEPGARNDAYLDFIADEVGDHIGDKTNSPSNIEAWSYLPDVFFPYNRANDAWKYMTYILSVKDDPHERPSQGTNGDYPEISFTIISQTVEGMMGMEADAYNHKVVTAPRLPDEVRNVSVKYIQMGDHELDLAHDGLTKSTLTNHSENALEWEARFYGEYKYVNVDGVQLSAQQKDVNGVTVSYVTVPVAANGTVVCEATNEVDTSDVSSAPTSTVTVNDAANGTVTVNKDYATMGSTVVITAVPAQGYVLDSLKAVDASGSELTLRALASGGYAFTMPGSKVTVTAVFAPEGGGAEEGFTDVPDGVWYSEAVAYVTGQGLMNGTGETTFSPMLSMSRAMLVTVLYRLEGEPQAGACPFTDVPGGTWYTDAVAWAAANGIVTGVSDTRFAPEDEITRESLAVILYRYAAWKDLAQGEAGDLTVFADGASVSGWAADATAWAVGRGILTGKSGNALDPQGTATRAEVAMMLMRFHRGMQA